MKWSRVVLGAALLSLAAGASAQDWPKGPIKIVVPFTAGGNTDGIARIAAEALQRKLGTSVIVENKPGANGAIAVEAVARSTPDGHTLLMASAPRMVVLPHLTKTKYDPFQDFKPVSIVASNMFAVAVNQNVPAKTLPEFIKYVQARPAGSVAYASAGNGSVSHLSMAMLAKAANLEMTHVPYKGGSTAMADLLAGTVPVYFGNVAEALPHMNGGKIRVLAVSGSTRDKALPDVKTVKEAGLPNFASNTWNGIAAPAKTPDAVVQKLADAIRSSCKEPEVLKKLDQLGVEAVCDTPQEFATRMKADDAFWASAVRASGAKLE